MTLVTIACVLSAGATALQSPALGRHAVGSTFTAAVPALHGRAAFVRMSEEAQEAAAIAATEAAANAAEKFALQGGNGGDHFGTEGILPVVAAAVEAAGAEATVKELIESAAAAAADRTNANAGRVADAIIVALKPIYKANVGKVVRTHPITGQVRYGSLQKFSAAPWTD